MRESGGKCVKFLKRGWNRKEGRGNKKLKKGGQGVGVLKRGGWNPLTNYDIYIYISYIYIFIYSYIYVYIQPEEAI